MIEIILVNNSTEIEQIEHLADTIWRAHYIPIIGLDQVNYMLNKFQSKKAITEQINSDYEYYLIRFEHKNVGYCSVQKRKQQLFLSKIYVLEKCRGKGIGKKAMDFIAERARQLECKSITLTVNKYNSNAMKAYEKIGFIKIDAIVQDIGRGFVMDDFVYERIL